MRPHVMIPNNKLQFYYLHFQTPIILESTWMNTQNRLHIIFHQFSPIPSSATTNPGFPSHILS
jgi:hypothetical protein